MKCFIRKEHEETRLIRTKVLWGFIVLGTHFGQHSLGNRSLMRMTSCIPEAKPLRTNHLMGLDNTGSTVSYAIPAFSLEIQPVLYLLFQT